MKDYWLRFGCFLTGYNYGIITNSSEASAQAVKKYLSAMLIVSTLWGFIGYAFTQRYLHGGTGASVFGGVLMAVMVIQIERQIILAVGKNTLAFGFRILIGMVMAVIGSVIIDQIVFKDDVEKKQISSIQQEVNKLLPVKTQELSAQINQLDNSLVAQQNERAAAIADISRNPTIYTPTSVVQYQMDSGTRKLSAVNKTVTSNAIANPRAELIPEIDAQIKFLREQKTAKENEKLNIQQVLEGELKSKVGFLDELNVLFTILLSSRMAMIIWTLIFFFFLAIELFVMLNKLGDAKNDYDKTIMHQMETHMVMLDNLKEKRYDRIFDN